MHIIRRLITAAASTGVLASTLAGSTVAQSPVWAEYPNPAIAVWSADQIDPALIATPAGCADTTTAAGLDSSLRDPIGPVKGFDSPRIVDLGDGRHLWLLQDAFVDYTTTPRTMAAARYINNAVLVQDAAGCFTVIARGDRTKAKSFEAGTDPADPWLQFWWPAGASAASGQLQVLWVEMSHSPHENRPPGSGPFVYPVATWHAVYDLETFERLSFVPAPNPGVAPIVGYETVDDPAAGYTYMFSNTFLQDLTREQVAPYQPRSATVTTLARVPVGRLDLTPEFWDGTGWSADPTAAAPISARGSHEYIMHPRLINGIWWSTTLPDAGWTREVIVETAPAPQGPWTPVATFDAVPHSQADGISIVMYAPILTPWTDKGTGTPIVVLSQIDPDWYQHGGGDPARYRPQAIPVAATV